ncbi:MAG TPA: phosphatidate cytidylyltransferase [Acidimicrobiales bacterium]|nr:phosphatidate cytidylyltransferase [Acidimicrobiales bacterium]
MDEENEHESQGSVPAEPITERVRIIGAEPAGAVTEAEGLGHGHEIDAPADPLSSRYLGFDPAPEPSPPAPPPPAASAIQQQFDESALAAPELPRWTDPPTGQVPAILDRRGDDSAEDRIRAAAGDSGPVWREHQHEWEDSGFEPAMLADDEPGLGVLGEQPLEERRPWEFDDLTETRAMAPATASAADATTAADAGAAADDAWPESGQPEETEAGDPGEGSGATWWDEPGAGAAATAAAAAAPITSATAVFPVAGSTKVDPVGTPRRRRRPAPPRPSPTQVAAGRNVPVAVATGVGIAVVALACFKAGTVASLILATVVVTLAAAECFASLRRAGMRPATLLGLVATVAVMVSAYTKGIAAVPLVLVLVLVMSMVWYLAGAERGSPLEGISATVVGFAWVGLLGSFAALLLAPSIYPARHGIAFLLGAVVATVGEDVGALAIGSWLGRHQLAPHVSPNKTWEGAIGGAVLAVVASAAITGQVHPWTPGKAAVLGLVVAVVAPIGDLCESMVKRDLGLKDMGSMLPGHGGVLDRVDALLFVLPVTYYLVRILNLG